MNKKILFWVITALLSLGFSACASRQPAIYDIHSSRNSVDWPGVYKGTIPSASGSGINVQINLNPSTFELIWAYAEKPENTYIQVGEFKWDKTERYITLDVNNFPPHYWVGERKLTQLDMKGKVITGNLADDYVLRQERTFGINF